jgi:hypothetical protein
MYLLTCWIPIIAVDLHANPLLTVHPSRERMFTPVFLRSETSRLLVRRQCDYHDKCKPDYRAGQMQEQSYYQYRG